jgi:predicted MFS family arabinose efflux permease
VLSAAAFVYVTAEMVPVGALPAIAADLRVSEALVGTLLASYALVAALTTVPLVRLTARWPRRTTLLLTLVCLTASQLISALAPNFTVLAGGRVFCALMHGLMWSVIAPIGATLPPMPMSRDDTKTVRRSRRHHRNGRLVTLTVLTLVGVTGHFISYTFIVVIIRDVVGVNGPQLAWLLAAFGIAGLVSMGAMARPLDRWPQASVVGCLAVLATAFAVLTSLAFGHSAGLLALSVGVGAIVLWGAASTALPPMLQAAAMRTAPDDPDGASGLYVTGFQVGIMAGSLSGGLLYEHGGLALMIAASTALVMVALTCVTATRGLFEVPQAISRK